MRFSRRLRPLVLARKKNAMGQDCRGLAGPSRVRRRPCGRFVSNREKISPVGRRFVGWDFPASSARTREKLGWNPTGPALLT